VTHRREDDHRRGRAPEGRRSCRRCDRPVVLLARIHGHRRDGTSSGGVAAGIRLTRTRSVVTAATGGRQPISPAHSHVTSRRPTSTSTSSRRETMFCSRANARGRVRDWARFRPTPGLNEGQPFDWAGIQTGPGGPRGSGGVPGRYGAKRTSPKGEEKELTLLDRWTCANGKE
jgi:hypothetical protein